MVHSNSEGTGRGGVPGRRIVSSRLESRQTPNLRWYSTTLSTHGVLVEKEVEPVVGRSTIPGLSRECNG